MSARVQPKASAHVSNSLLIVMPLISRLSVLSVTRKRKLAQQLDRVRRDGARGAGVHVRRRADLEGDAAVAHEVGESTEVVVAVVLDDVVRDAHAVAQALGVAELHGLPDRRAARTPRRRGSSCGSPRAGRGERREVLRRWEAVLGSRDVEAADARVAEVDGQLRDRLAQVRLAHRREDGAHDDRVALGSASLHAVREALQHRFDDFVQGQTAVEVQFGRESNLGVDDAVAREVERRFEGDALEVSLVCITAVVCAKPSR